MLAPVVELALSYSLGVLSSARHDDSEDRRAQWRNLFGSFRNVEILRMHSELSQDIPRSLLPGLEGEPLPSQVLLPRLKELQCIATGDLQDAGNAFAAFLHAREAAGHPVRLVHAPGPVLLPASTGTYSRAY